MEQPLPDAAAHEELIAYYSDTANATLCDAANLAEAQLHGKASGVYPLEPGDVLKISEKDRCPCCFFPHQNHPQFSLHSLDALKCLGLGFPFLFYLEWYFIGLMSILLLVAAIPCLVGNLVAADKDGDVTGVIASSLGGMKARVEDGYWPSILHLIALVLICLGHFLATLHLRRRTKWLNQGSTTPSDFTVVLKNLGRDFKEQDLISYLEAPIPTARCLWGTLTTKVKVEKCDVSYDIRDYTEIVARLQDLTMRRNISVHGYTAGERACRCVLNCCFPHSKRYLEPLTDMEFNEQIEVNKGLLNAMEKERQRDLPKTGVAFLAFTSQSQVKAVLRAWKSNIFTRFLSSLFLRSGRHLFNNHIINVKRAPEPTDIIWDNLRFSRLNRVIRECAILLVLGMILVCSCFMLIGLAQWQRNLRDANENTNRVMFSAIPAAVIILIVNIVVDLVIRLLAFLERHHTYTERTLSTARKLTVILTLNTLLFPLLANIDTEDWYRSSGLANNIFWVSISTAFAKSLIKLFHPLMLWRLFRRYQVTRLIQNPDKHIYVSQAKANLYYQNEEIDIADCYSDLLVRLLLAFAYAPLLPVIVPILILGYLFDYAVNKFVLLRLSCRPKLLGEKIAFKMMFFVKPGIVLYGFSILFFFKNLDADTLPIGIIAVSIGGFYWILHTTIFSLIFRLSKEKFPTNKTFSVISPNFFPVNPYLDL